MGDTQQEIATASKRFNDHIEQLLRFSIQQSNRKESTETLLARNLCKILKSHGEVWTGNFPLEDTAIMKAYLNGHGIPYVFTNGINGMNTIMVDAKRMDEVYDFHSKIKQLSASNTKVANAKEWFSVERSIGEHKSVMFQFKKQNSEILSERDVFQLNYIKRQLYANGKGYSYIYTKGIASLNDQNEVNNMTNIIATRLSGAANNNINKPDLLQAITTTAFCSENVAKMISEDTREKVLSRELDKFSESVNYGSSIYLTDVFHSNNSYLLYNSQQNMIGKYIPETDTVKCVISDKELKKIKDDCFKNNKDFTKELSNILSGHATQMSNVKCLNASEKQKYDLMSEEQKETMKDELLNKLSTAIDKSSEEGSERAYNEVEQWLSDTEAKIIQDYETEGKIRDIDYTDDDIIAKIEQEKIKAEEKGEAIPKELYKMNFYDLHDYLKGVDLNKFDYVPDVNSKEFNQMMIDRIKVKENNMENPNLTLFAGFAMNVMEEMYSSRVASFVNSMQQKDVDLPFEMKLNNLYQSLLKDLNDENGTLKEFSDPDLFLSSVKSLHPELSEEDIAMMSGLELDSIKDIVKEHLKLHIQSCHVVENSTLEDIFNKSDELENKSIPTKDKEKHVEKENVERVI